MGGRKSALKINGDTETFLKKISQMMISIEVSVMKSFIPKLRNE